MCLLNHWISCDKKFQWRFWSKEEEEQKRNIFLMCGKLFFTASANIYKFKSSFAIEAWALNDIDMRGTFMSVHWYDDDTRFKRYFYTNLTNQINQTFTQKILKCESYPTLWLWRWIIQYFFLHIYLRIVNVFLSRQFHYTIFYEILLDFFFNWLKIYG